MPPFEQLRAQVAAQVASGDLEPGSRLGTVRQTAADLGLAVNTVARAYRELEAGGVIVTQGRKGTFIRSGVVDGRTDTATAARAAATDYVTAVRRLGLNADEALRLVERAWSDATR